LRPEIPRDRHAATTAALESVPPFSLDTTGAAGANGLLSSTRHLAATHNQKTCGHSSSQMVEICAVTSNPCPAWKRITLLKLVSKRSAWSSRPPDPRLQSSAATRTRLCILQVRDFVASCVNCTPRRPRPKPPGRRVKYGWAKLCSGGSSAVHDEDTYDKLERMLRKLRHTKLRYLLECVCAHLCVRVLCID